jgi:hypothetical protein
VPKLAGFRREVETPNITGRFWDLAGVLTTRMGTGSGCFSSPTDGNSAISLADVSTPQPTGDGMDFDASKSSSVYFGSTMQPAALQALPCIKL